jgi:type IV secretory pathway VirB2 component (pilin)
MDSSSLPAPRLQNQPASPRWIWIAFSLCAVATVSLFFIPAFIIRPFRHQAPRALLAAMALRQRAPLGTLIAALACLILAYELWRTATRWRKTILVVTLLIVTFSAVMARLNYFEWMFHPIAGAQFVAQSASKLDAKEMILAVRLGDEARAYPISQMAYHHVLNDVVAGVPIAVTY